MPSRRTARFSRSYFHNYRRSGILVLTFTTEQTIIHRPDGNFMRRIPLIATHFVRTRAGHGLLFKDIPSSLVWSLLVDMH